MFTNCSKGLSVAVVVGVVVFVHKISQMFAEKIPSSYSRLPNGEHLAQNASLTLGYLHSAQTIFDFDYMKVPGLRSTIDVVVNESTRARHFQAIFPCLAA